MKARSDMPRYDGPLRGIKVLELGHIVAGPTASLILAELGAEVIKVERPGSGDQARASKANQGHFVSYNFNKKSIAVDISQPEGRDTVLALVARTDIVVDNFAPGSLTRLGLGYDVLSEANPGVIHCSIKGFLPGPYGDRPLTDEPAQMMGGLAFMTGPLGQPLRAGTSIVDISGAMFGVIAILAALHERHESGRGKQIHLGLFESVVFMVGQHIANTTMTGIPPVPMPERGMGRALGWGIYRIFTTRDDRSVFVAVLSDLHWERYCSEFGLDDLWADASLRSNTGRAEQYERLSARTAELVSTLDFDDAIRRLEKAKVPFAPVNTPADLPKDPHLQATGMIRPVLAPDGRLALVAGLPIAADHWFVGERTDPPALGADTDEVLKDLKFTS
jgi:crotonobetainyl-CoA:carnitine CoA-transferase CaiB-like acyl-CoA transferase